MNKISTTTSTKVTKEILTVGFDRSFFNVLTPPPSMYEDVYSFKASNNGFQAFLYLKRQCSEMAGMGLPHAVICDLDFLEQSEFFLLDSLRQHHLLRKLPFIVIANEGRKIDRADLLSKGVDDCYVGSVSSRDLHKRIEFLHYYKPELIGELSDEQLENLEYRMPLGKRIFDIVFASVMLLILSPLLALIAILVKLGSKGPILYSSKRVGTGYQVFDFLKFRSMCVDADAQLKKLAHLNHYDDGSNTNGSTFVKLKNDPRITWVGKIIRKTSLDELPQLINVLRGDMSIVGNRPLPLYEAEQMTRDEWSRRFWAPAGITGLWQTCGKGKDNMTVEERVELDVEYAEHCSMLMDAQIISRTLPAMIQKEA
ncbi:MAG: sugar transferase [Bacteroidota bacterium]